MSDVKPLSREGWPTDDAARLKSRAESQHANGVEADAKLYATIGEVLALLELLDAERRRADAATLAGVKAGIEAAGLVICQRCREDYVLRALDAEAIAEKVRT